MIFCANTEVYPWKIIKKAYSTMRFVLFPGLVAGC